MSDPELKDAIEKGDDTGNGKSLAEALKDGDVKIDEDGNLVDKDGNPVTIVPGTMDNHDGWDELPEEDREFIKGKVAKALEDAVKECDKTGQWGSIPSECRAQLREMISKEIPWQAVLKKFCGMTRRAHRRSNVKRLHRKYPGIHPGMQKGYTSSIAVYIDQSGSVGNGELEQLFGELRSLAKNTGFTCFHFDCTVDEKSETEWKKGRTPETHRTRSGGTCFREVTRHAVKNKHRFDGYLILTDGYAPDPGPSVLKRGWVITPGGDDAVGKAHRKDFVIALKTPKA
jgi:predicted metal-dependent peptidase